jgi:large repetitive protein
MAVSSPAVVSLTIDPVFDAPVASSDSYSLNQNTTFFVPVMMNDVDVDSTVLSLTGYTNTSHGVLTVSGTGFDYTPMIGYIGSDTFTYQIIDDTNLSSTAATVNLNVISTNAPPIASSGSFTVNEDGVFTGTITASDPENSTLTYIIDTLPSQGTLSIASSGTFIYTPNPNYF